MSSSSRKVWLIMRDHSKKTWGFRKIISDGSGRSSRYLFPRLALGISVCLLFVLSVSTVAIANDAAVRQSLAEEAQENLGRLTVRTAQFRTVGMLDASRLNMLFARENEEPFSIRLLDVPDTQTSVILWSYFFRVSQVYHARLNSPRPVAAFYNAMADAWLLTEWSMNDAEPRLINTAVRLSKDLSGSQIKQHTSLPEWLEKLSSEGLLMALQQQTASSVTAFTREHAVLGSAIAQLASDTFETATRLQLLANRLGVIKASLIDFQKKTQVQLLQQTLASHMAVGDKKAIISLFGSSADIPVINSIVELPQNIREAVTPVFMLDLDQEIILISATATQGRYFFVTRVDKTDKDIRFISIAVLDAFQGAGP